jgi:hypothetical protein
VRPTHSWLQPKAPSSYLGRRAVNLGAFKNLRAPERLSFPPEVNGNSQRFRTILCVIEGPPPCTIASPNRLQSIDETSYVVCRTLVCISGPVSSLVRRLRGALINNRGAFQKSSGTRRILPTGLLTARDGACGGVALIGRSLAPHIIRGSFWLALSASQPVSEPPGFIRLNARSSMQRRSKPQPPTFDARKRDLSQTAGRGSGLNRRDR